MRISIAVAALILLGCAQATLANDLVGKLGGAEWKGTFCKVKEQGNGKLSVSVYAKPVKGMKEEFTTPCLIVTLPGKTGTYDTAHASVTFFTPPGDNKISTDNKIVVTPIATGISIAIDAKYDDENWAKGSFTIDVTK